MRLNLRLVDPRSGKADDVVLTAEPETAMTDVVAALTGGRREKVFHKGVPLAAAGQLGASGLVDGAVLTVGTPAAPGTNGGGRLELAVVGGPLSGRAWPMGGRPATVGRSEGADVFLDHHSVSRAHFRLQRQGEAWQVEDLGSTNGTWLAGQRIDGTRTLAPGDIIEAGACLLQIRPRATGDADLQPDDAGGLAFNRPARIRPAPRKVSVAYPARPAEREPYPFPWVQVVAPLLLAAVAVTLFRRVEFLLFALLSPILAVANSISYRRRDAGRTQRDAERYAAEVAEADSAVYQAAEHELTTSRDRFPDPTTLAAIATGPGRRLWERRPSDLDAALLRVGVADRPASVTITSRGADRPPPPPVLTTVPVTVDLAAAGVLGVAGPAGDVRSVARWLVSQLTTLCSPRDVEVVVLAPPDTGGDWDWVRWLPHARVDEPHAPPALVGNDKLTQAERVKELLKLLDGRVAAARESHGAAFTPTVVVVFDGIRALRALPGVPRLLKEGPAVGICAIGLDDDVTRLAEEGRAQLVLDAGDPSLGVLEVDGAEAVPGILLDRVGAGWADEVARALAPLRDAGGEDGEAVIPRTVRYVDLAMVDPDSVDDVLDRWDLGGRTTEALVGVSVDGPFSVDLRRDGPHALVAGTTGAGKSEFLQTLVVSLSLANRPNALNFVLVDYKGASAFADCERLPHTVGLVTNLDGHLTERALVSLDAELKRREQALKDGGVPDIDAAWEQDEAAAAAAGLTRLVIVIDEFAELARELPDFVSGLIRIARVGRSLGVHLILATQRPAGVVSPEMRANTGLRVGFRMEDKQDSVEVLEAPNAADVARSTPGRGFVRTGGRSALVEFQAARVAGRRRGATENVPPPRVDRAPWSRLGYPLAAPAHREERDGVATDLHALVDVIAEASALTGLPRSRSPWLPPLPAEVPLPPVAAAGRGGVAAVSWGLEDLPSVQAQRPATFDVAGGGHLLIAGSTRSGRSTALRTLAGSLARSISPSDVHLYGLDFGNGALLPLADLPHCGGVVGRAEAARVERLLARLVEEVARRQELLARAGVGDIGEQRRASPPGERLPYVVVLLDRWEGFTAQFSVDSGSELPAAVLRLVREGAGAGLRLVVTGDRSLLTDRIAALVEDKLVLRLADREDYRLAGLKPRNVPDEVPPGRAFRADSGAELQVAYLGADPSAPAQAAALRRIAKEGTSRWPAKQRLNRPFRVEGLPAHVDFEQAWAAAAPVRPHTPLWALVGVGGDELEPVGVDLSTSGGFVVAGPSKSGRSTALRSMAKSLAAGGAAVVAVCPRPSPLADLAGTKGVRVVSGVPDPEELTTVLARAKGPLAVVVDDAEVFARTPADDAVRDLVRERGRGRLAVIVGGQLEELKAELRGTVVEARKAKAGLLLSPPSALDGDLVGARLPRPLVGRMPPGRGILALDGEVRLVQVPG